MLNTNAVPQFQLGSPPPPMFQPQPSCKSASLPMDDLPDRSLTCRKTVYRGRTRLLQRTRDQPRSVRTVPRAHGRSRSSHISPRAFYNSIMSRSSAFGSMGLGREEARYWHRRIYSGIVRNSPRPRTPQVPHQRARLTRAPDPTSASPPC